MSLIIRKSGKKFIAAYNGVKISTIRPKTSLELQEWRSRVDSFVELVSAETIEAPGPREEGNEVAKTVLWD